MKCPHCKGTGTISAEQLGFGGMVLKAREAAGLTQQELSDAVGISRAQIANIEAGRSNPPVESVRAYARALNIEVSELIP